MIRNFIARLKFALLSTFFHTYKQEYLKISYETRVSSTIKILSKLRVEIRHIQVGLMLTTMSKTENVRTHEYSTRIKISYDFPKRRRTYPNSIHAFNRSSLGIHSQHARSICEWGKISSRHENIHIVKCSINTGLDKLITLMARISLFGTFRKNKRNVKNKSRTDGRTPTKPRL